MFHPRVLGEIIKYKLTMNTFQTLKNEILEAKTIEQLNILQDKLNSSQLEETLASALQMLLDDIKASKLDHKLKTFLNAGY